MNKTFLRSKDYRMYKFTTKNLFTNCYSSNMNCTVLVTELYCFHNDVQLLNF